MKGIIIVGLCFLLIGCTPRQHLIPAELNEPIEDTIGWAGEYVNGDVELTIMYNHDIPDGFEFNLGINHEGFGEFTRFISEDKTKAIFDTQEDGYTLVFTLKKNSVIVEETGGISYLDTELSGEYMKK